MSKIIFLFGAGASYGSQTINSPPLGQDLFKELCVNYPELEFSLNEFKANLSDIFRKNFEHGMSEIFNSQSTKSNLDVADNLNYHLAKYILNFKPEEDSLYVKLIKTLHERDRLKDILFSTINYDLLLEYSIKKNGFNHKYDSEFTNSTINLLKLHGSPNFIFNNDNINMSGNYCVGSPDGIIVGSGTWKEIDLKNIEKVYEHNDIKPIFANYMEKKPIPYSKDLINKHQKQWVDAIQNAKKILIVGVKYVENDGHIWQHLLETSCPLYYVGDKDSKNEIERRLCNKSQLCYLGECFDSAFSKIINLVE